MRGRHVHVCSVTCSVPFLTVEVVDVGAVETDPNICTFDLAEGTKNACHGILVGVVVKGVEGHGLHEFGFE